MRAAMRSSFLRYAQRSCSEVQSQLYVALDQDYIDQTKFEGLYRAAAHTKAKIGGFIAYLLKNERPEARDKISPASTILKEEPRKSRATRPAR
jgi:hypothetical protein